MELRQGDCNSHQMRWSRMELRQADCNSHRMRWSRMELRQAELINYLENYEPNQTHLNIKP